MKLIAFPLFILLIVFSLPAYSSENIRVSIADNRKSITLDSGKGLETMGASSETLKKQVMISVPKMKTAAIRLRAKDNIIRVGGKQYRGIIEIRKKTNGTLLVVNELDIEDYLKGVVSAEVPNGWSLEALKAQAVASRTYALYQKRENAGRAYHILSSVNSQLYHGHEGERKNASKAVQATRGMVLLYGEHVIPAFYHSSCGGHTEDASELWGIDVPYLKGVDCDCQEISPFGLWEKRIPLAKVKSALARIGYPTNEIAEIKIGALTHAGRVKTVAISAQTKSTAVPGEPLRAALGNTVIPSIFYEVEMSGNEVVFSGRGNGHGVGLCQWGAQEMALRGMDFRSILSHYYPGTNLNKMWQ